MVAEESKEKDADGLGKVGGEGVEAEETEAERNQPIREGCFLEIADSVDVQCNEIAGERHVAGCAGVGCIGVVEQWGAEERCKEDDEPKAAEDEESSAALGGAGVGGDRLFSECFQKRLISHDFACSLSINGLWVGPGGGGRSCIEIVSRGCNLLVVGFFDA